MRRISSLQCTSFPLYASARFTTQAGINIKQNVCFKLYTDNKNMYFPVKSILLYNYKVSNRTAYLYTCYSIYIRYSMYI